MEVAVTGFNKAGAFWRQLLKDFNAPTPLVVDQVHKPDKPPSGQFAEKQIQLPTVTAAALQRFGRENRLTQAALLQAAWACLLSRYSGEADIVFGINISTTDLLPVRLRLSPTESVRAGLKQLQDLHTQLQQFGSVPLAEIEKLSDIHAGNALFASVVILADDRSATNDQSDVRRVIGHMPSAALDYPLTVVVSLDSEPAVAIRYEQSRFESKAIQRMLSHYQTLLEGIIANPDSSIAELPLLTEAERHQMLVEWNDTQATYHDDRCVHQIFEARAQDTPDAVAVECEGERLSYRELNGRANQLARYLQKLDVGPDTLVGIAMERSLNMIVAILGILKAGGAYLPLEPTYPKERLAFMLDDAQVLVLLTQKDLLQKLLENETITLCLDTDWQIIARQDASNPDSLVTPENVAYVIYTSGSTGKPKGVLVTHKNVVRLFHATWPWYRFDHNDVWTLFHSYAFDFSVWEIWGALFYGGQLVIVPYWVSRSPGAFYDLLCEQQVTVLNQTPSAFRQLISAEETKGGSSELALRFVIFGGEALELRSLRPWFDRHGDQTPRLVNMYGITETTVHVTYRSISLTDVESSAGSVIGTPIPDLQVYLLDRHMNPVPIGVPGEIYVGGAGVARGYLKRQALTAERFVVDPFRANDGARLYQTGDLARYLPKGDLEYLGRIDHQVKIRGFRIELGEIEAVLARHPGVRESVLILREDLPGQQRLIGYVVPDPNYRPVDAEAENRVTQVQTIFDQTYSQKAPTDDQAFNIIGWNSSYTGELIPERQMQEWVDNATTRILSLQPRRALEIGCGTGMILFQVAPHCSEYRGTDLSQVALQQLEHKLNRNDYELPHVKLLHQAADEFDGLPTERFDTVIINSVVQLFPSIEYLVKVMEGLVNLVEPGGRIFVGDVRSLMHLQAYHTSVELHKALPSMPTVQLRQRVHTRMAMEEELVVAPAFFTVLKQHLSRIGAVEVHLKRGRYHNELTRFRYDVVVHVGPAVRQTDDHPGLDWQGDSLTLETTRCYLADNKPAVLAITRIPNSRLTAEMKTLELLGNDDRPATVAELRETLVPLRDAGIDPEDVWAIGSDLPYAVDITWSSSGGAGCYDVLFTHKGQAPSPQTVCFPVESAAHKPWAEYANNPSTGLHARELMPELRSYLKEKLPDYMVPSALLILNALPLTANGKVDRQALPVSDHARPELAENYVAPRNAVEEALAKIWTEVLGLDRVGVCDNFFDLGGDSIINLQIVARANAIGLKLTPVQLFRHHTIAELASVAGTGEGIEAEQGLVAGAQALTAMQSWVFEHSPLDPHYTNQVTLLKVHQELDPALIEKVTRCLLEHHDALRLRFQKNGSTSVASYADPIDSVPFEIVDLSTVPEPEQSSAIENAAIRIHASLNLVTGPLLRVTLFDLGPRQSNCLMLSINHLIIDAVSTRILLEDFQTAYGQLKNDEPVKLSPKTTSFKYCAERLKQYAQSAAVREELPYWLDEARKQVVRLLVDFPGGANTEDSARSFSTLLTAGETRYLLQELPKVYRTRINEVLLAALTQALTRWTGAQAILIDTEGHGREAIFEDVDLSRTVGVFSAMFPMLLELQPDASPGEALKSIKEQMRRLPGRGLGYGLLRFVSDDAETVEQLRALPSAELLFNYLGQYDQSLPASSLFELAHEPIGPNRSPREQRPHILDVTSLVAGGRLRIDWTFSENLHTINTIKSLAEEFMTALRSIISHCQVPEVGGFTPSDFPLAGLNQHQLDTLVAGDREIEDIYPLSPLQEGMLFHALYAPESGVYCIQLSARMPGDLDLKAFEASWQQVVTRHAIFRTRFVWKDLERPLQVLQRRARIPFQSNDWRQLSAAEQERRLREYREGRHHGYEISKAPLMSVILIRMSDTAYRFLWNFHHLLLDGWSMTAVLEEVFATYEALRQDHVIEPKPAHQFVEYIAWVASRDMVQTEIYWKNVLSGFSAPTPIPGDQDPHGMPGTDGKYDKIKLVLSQKNTESLSNLARQRRLTMNTVLHGAWGLLLGYWSSRDDVVFGTVVPGRPPDLSGADSAIGLFMNTLPLRIQISPEDQLFGWLTELQTAQIEMRQYEYSPLVNVQQWSEAARGLPLFESVIAVQGYLRNSHSLADWALSLGLQEFDLVDWNSLPLSLAIEVGEELTILSKYNCGRFEELAVKHMLADLEKLLIIIIDKPDASIGYYQQALRAASNAQQVEEGRERKRINVGRLQSTRRKNVMPSTKEN